MNPITYALAAVAAALALLAGLQTVRLASAHTDLAAVHIVLETERRQAAEAKAEQAIQIRNEDRRRDVAALENVNAAIAQATIVRRGVSRADVSGSGLRVRAATYAAGSCGSASDPGAAPGGPPAQDRAGVLADLLGRAVDRARQLAAVADERGTAGQACERAYLSLTPAGGPPASDPERTIP